MINIKALWFYAALAASACGGAGIYAAVSPSQNALEKEFMKTQIASLRNCEPSEADIKWRSGKVQNSPAKGY